MAFGFFVLNDYASNFYVINVTCCDIIKMIYERKQKRLAQGKKCTATDARYFQMAENLLYMELGVALGKPKEEICKTIINYINQSKQEN